MKAFFHRRDAFPPPLLHWCFAALLLLAGAGPSFSREETPAADIRITETRRTATVLGRPDIARTDIARTGREAWGLSETDWNAYLELMEGPSGLWYAHLDPVFVLGINAATEAERDRFARMVYEQERRRIDALLAFNRAYQRIARAERGNPGFDFFDDRLLSPSAAAGPGTGNAGMTALIDRALDSPPARIQLFVARDCERCAHAARTLATSGRELDIRYVGARSDGEISRWARAAGIPPERVRDRSVTLNHARDELAQTGRAVAGFPILFPDASLGSPVTLEAALSR